MAVPDPNGGPQQQFPLSGEMVVSAAEVSVGKAPTGQTVMIVQPHGTMLRIIIMMNQGASELGKALVASDSGLIIPP